MAYQATSGSGNYAGAPGSTLNTQAFIDLGALNLIDSVLATAAKSGYRFTGLMVTHGAGTPASFCGRALPAVFLGITATGTRKFGVATAGVINSADSAIPFGSGCSVGADGPAFVSTATPLSN